MSHLQPKVQNFNELPTWLILIKSYLDPTKIFAKTGSTSLCIGAYPLNLSTNLNPNNKELNPLFSTLI